MVSLRQYFCHFLAQCDPGTYSRTGVGECSPCNHGEYQPLVGQTSCIVCLPAGYTTRDTGSTRRGLCIGG